jgi:integrase/recombinase XerD
MSEDISRRFLLERFAEYLELELGSSARTREAYQRDLELLATWAVDKHSVKDAASLEAAHLREWVYAQKDQGRAATTIKRRISAVRTWYRFLLSEGVVKADPSEKLESPRGWRRLPDVLSVAEVERIIDAIGLDDPMAFRDRALLELAYGAGLRVSEWCSLDVKDVMLDELVVRVFGKGDKERLVPIGRKASGAVSMYLR